MKLFGTVHVVLNIYFLSPVLLKMFYIQRYTVTKINRVTIPEKEVVMKTHL